MSLAPPIPGPVVSLRHYLGLILGALCIAFAPIFAVMSGRGDDGVGMWDAAFWRVAIGAIALGLSFGVRRRRILPTKADFQSGHLWIWFPGLVFAFDFWAWHWSFEHTSVANSTLLANTAILWVTLFAWFVWKERITKLFVIGAGVAFTGMVVLMLSSTTREAPTAGNPVFGDFLSLLTAGFYAAYQLSMKRFRREHSAPVLMFWASLVGAIVLFPLAILHEDPFLPGSVEAWLPLLGLGVISHACGQGLIAYGLGGVPASLASVSLLVQPVATGLLGVWLLSQPLVSMQALGAVVVVIGLFFAIRGQMAKPKA
ncbi:MAG: DMT family transporter [Verrucomicrobiales bacterium]|nr:DMT family transporter [Verrucomicrobiales bacterium]